MMYMQRIRSNNATREQQEGSASHHVAHGTSLEGKDETQQAYEYKCTNRSSCLVRIPRAKSELIGLLLVAVNFRITK